MLVFSSLKKKKNLLGQANPIVTVLVQSQKIALLYLYYIILILFYVFFYSLGSFGTVYHAEWHGSVNCLFFISQAYSTV